MFCIEFLLLFIFINSKDAGKYTLHVINEAGEKTVKCNVSVFDAPSPPRDLAVRDVTSQSAALKWQEPAHDGGSVGITYKVEVKDEEDKKWKTFNENCIRCGQTVSLLLILLFFVDKFHKFSVSVNYL